jgi:hypothetical protein
MDRERGKPTQREGDAMLNGTIARCTALSVVVAAACLGITGQAAAITRPCPLTGPYLVNGGPWSIPWDGLNLYMIGGACFTGGGQVAVYVDATVGNQDFPPGRTTVYRTANANGTLPTLMIAACGAGTENVSATDSDTGRGAPPITVPLSPCRS